jgi:hypothetical protein
MMTIVFVLAVLGLFALVSLLLGDAQRPSADPRDDARFWTRYGLH